MCGRYDRAVEERYTGCLLGLALGDAVGARLEGNVAARTLWKALGLTQPGVLRWTDDTQMSLVLMQHLAAHGAIEQDVLARAWAKEARWRRGYGHGALRTLRMIRDGMPWEQAATEVFPDGSYGNGAAMRAAPVGVWFGDRDARLDAARRTAVITHAHPLGIEGAILMAEAAHLARAARVTPSALLEVAEQQEFCTRLEQIDGLLDTAPPAADVARTLGNDVRAHGSVVTAIYTYLRFREQGFEDLLAFVLALRGDTDTIAAMAGALYGIEHGDGALPAALLEQLEAVAELRAAARGCHAKAHS